MENLKLKEELEQSQQREKVLEEQKRRRSSLVDKSSFENVQQFQLEAAQKKVDDLEMALKKKNEQVRLLVVLFWSCFKLFMFSWKLCRSSWKDCRQ